MKKTSTPRNKWKNTSSISFIANIRTYEIVWDRDASNASKASIKPIGPSAQTFSHQHRYEWDSHSQEYVHAIVRVEEVVGEAQPVL